LLKNVALIMQHIRTQPISIFEVKVEAGWVSVALSAAPRG
jgi:hypothetical protein